MNLMNFKTYWSLQTEYDAIMIPIIQRDYAQGRETGKDATDIKHIREELVKKLIQTTIARGELTVNFVYGKADGSVFIPIDGQQRLTTLFLLHWYILANAEKQVQHLKPLLYSTRNTTKTFCEKLCGMPKLAQGDIYAIKDQIWFNSSYNSDPSVKGMLVMLETIAAEIRRQGLDFKDAAQYLTSDDCRIGFIYLPLEAFDEEDLYIKMNARGKKLTDFEIFKAKLQDSAALAAICANQEEIIEYIGRFNNEYCDLFYRYDRVAFDKLMMQFVRDLIKCDHFAFACSRVSSKNYRDHYANVEIGKLSGSVFFENYVEQPAVHGEGIAVQKDYNAVVQYSLKKMDGTLRYLSSNKKDQLFAVGALKPSHTITYEDLLQDDLTLSKDALRYAFHEFVFLMDPSTSEHFEAYRHWLRYVRNIINNTNFRSSDIAANVMLLFSIVMSELKKHRDNYDYKTVLQCIANTDVSQVSTQIRQKEEEQYKAKQMLTSADWEASILDAEEYYEDGQIQFLLDFAAGDLLKFKDYYEKSKQLFDEKKRPKPQDFLLERALLSLPDPSEDKRSYLLQDEKADYTLRCGESFKSELQSSNSFIKELLDRIGNRKDIETALQEIVTAAIFTDPKEQWKKLVVVGNLPALVERYNKVCRYKNKSIDKYISFSADNSVVLLLSRRLTSSFNIDVNSFLLYMQTDDTVKEYLNLEFATTTQLTDKNNTLLRYVEKTGLRIGYDFSKESYVNVDTNQTYTLTNAAVLLQK